MGYRVSQLVSEYDNDAHAIFIGFMLLVNGIEMNSMVGF